MNKRSPEELRAMVPPDADLRHISPDLRQLAVPIAELLRDPRNARKHPEKNLKIIRDSFLRFGQRQALTVNQRSLVTEAGNGRIQAAQALGWLYIAVSFEDDDTITATAYGLVDNQSALTSEWDDAIRRDLFQDLQSEGQDLTSLGFEADDISRLLANADSSEGSAESPDSGEKNGADKYTTKIEAPIYKPTGECPPLSALVSAEKCDSLVDSIRQAENVSEEEKAFLLLAAQRHLRFNYRNIAEYYAHASAHMQRLMEASALVIVDWNDAIAEGYVKLTSRMDELGIEMIEARGTYDEA